MATKTFTTYGKRSRRTVVTPLFAPPEPSSKSRANDTGLSPSPTSTGPCKAQSGTDSAGLVDNQPKPKRAARKPGLNRRKPHQHLVTPGKGRVSLLIASASRSVAGHKRLRAAPSPTKGRRRFQAPENPAQLHRISAPPSPLRETDVNRIHLPRLDNIHGPHFPEFDHIAITDHTLSPGKLAINAGTKDHPIDLSGNDGNDSELFSSLPLTRKTTGSQRRTSKDKVEIVTKPAIGELRSQIPSRSHDPSFDPARTSRHVYLADQKTDPATGEIHDPFPTSDTISPLSISRGRKLQHGVDGATDAAGPFRPLQSPTVVINSMVTRNHRHGSPEIPSSPEASVSGASNHGSQSFTPRHMPYMSAVSHARLPNLRKPLVFGSSPFPGKRRDSPFLRRGNGPVAPSFDELLTTFSDLSFSISIIATPASERAPARPSRISQLLRACHQDEVLDFSDFVRDFPGKYYAASPPYHKVGEASYSEVFGVGDIVVKIVPLLDEEGNNHISDERPPETPVEDALREILFISRMGSLQGGSGFSALLGAHVVQGAYPLPLLSEWDHWDLCNGSESIRPDCFPESQLYAVIEMSYSGQELEKYKFPKKSAWQQAASVFWQVARSLERAEHHLRFEHRDLHWGQVLILPVTNAVTEPTAPMDDSGHGVAVTVIDFGFSRMHAPDSKDPPIYTPFEPEVFEGQGDYQYDIYRMMRDHNGDEWADYHPMTNLMWLHYLAVKLLKHKGLRKPLCGKGTATAAFDCETRCHSSLRAAEELLRVVVQSQSRPMPAGKERRAVRGPKWQCAGDLCAWGREQQWIK